MSGIRYDILKNHPPISTKIKVEDIIESVNIRPVRQSGVEMLKKNRGDYDYTRPILVKKIKGKGKTFKYKNIDGNYRIALAKELNEEKISAFVISEDLTPEEELYLARQKNDMNEVFIKTTFTDDVKFIFQCEREGKSNNEISEIMSWGIGKVNNYTALKKIADEVWKIVEELEEKNLLNMASDNKITDIDEEDNDSKKTHPGEFSEKLLRNIINLPKEMQITLVQDLNEGKISKKEFKEKAKEYKEKKKGKTANKESSTITKQPEPAEKQIEPEIKNETVDDDITHTEDTNGVIPEPTNQKNIEGQLSEYEELEFIPIEEDEEFEEIEEMENSNIETPAEEIQTPSDDQDTPVYKLFVQEYLLENTVIHSDIFNIIPEEINFCDKSGRKAVFKMIVADHINLSKEADALFQEGEYKEAIKLYNKVIKLTPNNNIIWNNMGLAFDNLKKHDKAIKCYDKAIEIKTDYANAWNNKGFVLHKLKRYDEALECFEKAIELDPVHISAWNNKANVLYDLKRYDEELKCYKKLLELNPNDDNIKQKIKDIEEEIKPEPATLDIQIKEEELPTATTKKKRNCKPKKAKK